MFTDTQTELWFAIIAISICFFMAIEHEDISTKLINHKKLLQLVSVFFIVILDTQHSTGFFAWTRLLKYRI